MPGFTLCFTEWRIKQEDQKEDAADVNGTMDQRWRRAKISGVHMVKRQECCLGVMSIASGRHVVVRVRDSASYCAAISAAAASWATRCSSVCRASAARADHLARGSVERVFLVFMMFY